MSHWVLPGVVRSRTRLGFDFFEPHSIMAEIDGLQQAVPRLYLLLLQQDAEVWGDRGIEAR